MNLNDEPQELPELEQLPDELFALPPGAEQARAAILASTERWIDQRSARRRWSRLASLAALYLFGFATAWFARPDSSRAPEEQTVAAVEAPAPPRTPSLGAVQTPDAAPAAPETDTDPGLSDPPHLRAARPSQLERIARGGAPEHRPERLRQAGDLYLEEQGDLEAAMRCYSDYVALLPSEERGDPRAEDTWLLAALKHDLN